MKRNLLIKNKIAILRKEKGISQGRLADAVLVTRQTITSLEVGKYNASLELAYRISRYFNLSIEDIFDFTDLKEVKNYG